jgi:hypothetical protein
MVVAKAPETISTARILSKCNLHSGTRAGEVRKRAPPAQIGKDPPRRVRVDLSADLYFLELW